jgi:hypothetical protein
MGEAPRTRHRRLFIPGATENQASEIQAAALRPEGTLVFSLDARAVYEQHGVVVLEVPTGASLFRVTRDAALTVTFLHASPGTGTRQASVALPDLVVEGTLRIFLVWSADSIGLYVGVPGIGLLTAEGKTSAHQVRVTKEGIHDIGGEGVEVISYTAFQDGLLAVREAAIEAWQATKRAVEVHMESTTTEGHMGVVVQANLAIVMLATGVEVYAERRFAELPLEGRRYDLDAFIRRMIPAKFRRDDPPADMSAALVLSRVDFGNYEACNRAFAAGYGIRFATLGVPEAVREDVRHVLQFRHRIVHVSPLVGLLNQPEVPKKPPIFSTTETARRYLQSVDTFIVGLHEASLQVSAAPGDDSERTIHGLAGGSA